MRIQGSQQSSEVKIKSYANSLTESVIQTSADTEWATVCTRPHGKHRCYICMRGKWLQVSNVGQEISLFLEVFVINIKWGGLSHICWINLSMSKAFTGLMLWRCNDFIYLLQYYSSIKGPVCTISVDLWAKCNIIFIMNKQFLVFFSTLQWAVHIYRRTGCPPCQSQPTDS